MPGNKKPRWQREIETLLRRKVEDKELPEELKLLAKFFEETEPADLPPEEWREAFRFLFDQFLQDEPIKVAMRSAFLVGVTWERWMANGSGH